MHLHQSQFRFTENAPSRANPSRQRPRIEAAGRMEGGENGVGVMDNWKATVRWTALFAVAHVTQLNRWNEKDPQNFMDRFGVLERNIRRNEDASGIPCSRYCVDQFHDLSDGLICDRIIVSWKRLKEMIVSRNSIVLVDMNAESHAL